MAIITLLAALLLPAVNQAKAGARRIQCVDHLHEIGVGFVAFANDHHGQFPMAVPASDGGTLEFTRSGYVLQGDFYFCYRHFQAAANELVTPRLVVCPSDTRVSAASFAELGNSNLSYFVGVNAEFARPTSILAGDRNLTNDYAAPGSIARLGPSYALRWTEELHRFKGDLLFSDAHVEERNSPGLVPAGGQTPAVANLALPTVRPGNGPGPGTTTRKEGPFGTPPLAPPATGSVAISTVQVPRTVGLDGLPPGDGAAAKTSAPPVVQRQSTNAVPPTPPPRPGEETATASQFGIWLSAIAKGVTKSGLWWLYALLLLTVAAAVVLRKRPQSKNKPGRRAKPSPRFR
jgi:hypothetical protein